MNQQSNPMTGPQGPPPPEQPATPQRQATLEEYAVGVDQVNIELQRQTAAYGHFRDVIAQLDAIAQNDPKTERGQLPFVIVRFPQRGPTPGEIQLDMNTMPAEMLPQFRPLFESLTAGAGKSLVGAWDSFYELTDATRPIIAAAKKASG